MAGKGGGGFAIPMESIPDLYRAPALDWKCAYCGSRHKDDKPKCTECGAHRGMGEK
jgi:hypothetical protein